MAALAPVAVFHRELVLGQLCSYCAVLKSPGGLELLTADVVVEDVNVGGVCALPWIIRREPARVCLTSAAPCDPEVVETRTVETRLFACHLYAVRELRQVSGVVSSSGKSLSSAFGSVSDLV